MPTTIRTQYQHPGIGHNRMHGSAHLPRHGRAAGAP